METTIYEEEGSGVVSSLSSVGSVKSSPVETAAPIQ